MARTYCLSGSECFDINPGLLRQHIRDCDYLAAMQRGNAFARIIRFDLRVTAIAKGAEYPMQFSFKK
jgi:hypothetical protein